jgi:hypothetical protein
MHPASRPAKFSGFTDHLSCSYEFMGSADTLEGAIIIVIFHTEQLQTLLALSNRRGEKI